MPTLLSILDIIELSDVAVGLAFNYVDKQKLFGGTPIRPIPPVQMAIISSSLLWGYEGGAQSAAELRNEGNYLYWMLGKFQLEAQNIISGGGGGSVVPVPPLGNLPFPYDFIVSSVTSEPNPLKAGDSFVFLDGTNGTRDYRGYNLIFVRNNVTQNTSSLGGPNYFQWDRLDGKFTCIGSAQLDEVFALMPVG